MRIIINILLSFIIALLQLLGILRVFIAGMAILTTIVLAVNYYGTGHILKNILTMVISFWGMLFLHSFLLNFFIGLQCGINETK